MRNLRAGRGWEYAYKKELDQEIERLRDELERCQDRPPEMWHYLSGQICGIRVAISRLTEIRERFNVERDEDFAEANL